MFKKANFFQTLLLSVLLHQTVSHTQLDNKGLAHLILSGGTCVGNEQRPENQVACKDQPFGELVPYPGDCAKFLVCNCEYPTVKDCAAGTWFDNKLKICNFPQNVDCDNSGGGAITSSAMPTSSTMEPSDTSTQTTTSVTSTEPSATLPQTTTTVTTTKPCDTSTQTMTSSVTTTTTDDDWAKDCIAPEGMTFDICLKYDNGVLLRYPYDCNAYINCTQGCPVMTFCVPGKVFNDLLKICDTPETAHCESLPMPSTITEIITTTDYTPQNTPMICEPPSGISADYCALQVPGTLLPYPYDCSAYILCNWRCPFLEQCGPKEVFNVKTGSCACANSVECVEIPYPTLRPTTVTTDNPITPTPMVCEPPSGISADYCALQVPGTLYPYPYDCSAYILCNWLCPFLEHCGPNEVFNAKTGSCDCAHNVECIEIPYPTTEPSEPPTTGTSTEDPTTNTSPTTETSTEDPTTNTPPTTGTSTEDPTTNTRPTTGTSTEDPTTNTPPTTGTSTEDPTTNTPMVCEPPYGISADICAEQNPRTYLPYPYNCSAYILCNWLCPHLRYCSPDKVYNSLLGICDSAENVQCIEIPYPTPTEPTESTTGSTEGITTENPIMPPDVNPKLCEAELDYKMHPYEGHCQEYLLCIKGKVEIRSCPEGWLFNAELGMCDEAGEDVCYNGTTTTTAAATETTTAPIYDLCKDQPMGTSFPYTENCTMYYYCRGDGTYYLISCPFNNYYEPYSGDCGPEVSPNACKTPLTTTTMASTSTSSPAQLCEDQSAGITLPYEANCRQYIMCMGSGRYQLVNCPVNNFYYPDSGDCGPSTDEDICRKGTTATVSTSSTSQTTTVSPTSSSTATSTITATITTEAPSNGICGSYTHGELIEYPNNCQKYISCVRPIPIGFYCPSNWYFENNQQKCMPDTNGVCNEDPSSTTITPPQTTACDNKEKGEWALYPDNCQMFYECLGNGYFMLRICPENEYFDPLRGQCSSDVDSQYCHQDFYSTTAATPSPSQNLCYQKPIGSKIPYPGTCSKYIVCEQPIPVAHNCPQGLEFSSKNEKCVEPKDSDCGKGATNTTRCSGKSNYTLLPYENDCSVFVICLNNLEYVAYCNHGQYFDSLLGECSSEAHIESCLEDPITTTTTTATVTKTTSTSTSTSLEPTSTVSSSTVDPNLGPCYGQPEGTKLPYPNNCEKYIVCHNPIPVGYDCPDGLEFSKNLGECVSKEIANCSIKSTTTEEPTTTTTKASGGGVTCEGLPNGSTLTYPDDCSKYYICLNGNPRLTQCMPNSYYDPTSEECDSSSPSACLDIEETTTIIPTSTAAIESTTTTTTEGISDACHMKENGYTFVNSAKNCSQFYMCLNESAFLTNCPAATFYNPQLGECNSETSSDACRESETSTQTTEEIITHTRPTTTVTPIPSHKDYICCGHEPGSILSHPNDKTKYVICLQPLPEIVQCPDDTIFDGAVKQCVSTLEIGKKPQCSKLPNGTKWEYVGNCQKYFVCEGQKAFIYTCRKGEKYNPYLKKCVTSELYECRW